jgi:hypothetical protein
MGRAVTTVATPAFASARLARLVCLVSDIAVARQCKTPTLVASPGVVQQLAAQIVEPKAQSIE